MSNYDVEIGSLKAENANSLRVEAELVKDLRDMRDDIAVVRAKVQRVELILGAATALAGFIASQVIGLWADVFGHIK